MNRETFGPMLDIAEELETQSGERVHDEVADEASKSEYAYDDAPAERGVHVARDDGVET